jgi:O-antigen/teichoic acid export membrane protein
VPDTPAGITAAVLARNALRNVLGLGLPLVFALASVPLLVDALEPAAFGVLGLVWVFFGLFAELGLGRATTKFAAESLADPGRADAHRIARLGVLTQLGLGIVAAVLLAALAGPLAQRLAAGTGIEYETRAVLRVVAATLPAIMVTAALRGVLEAAHRFDLVNRVRIPLASSTYLLPAVVVLAGGGLLTVTAVLALARLGGAVAYGLLCAAVLGPARAARSGGPGIRDMLTFGAWQTVGGMLAPLLVYLDRLLLATIAGAAAVGMYTPAFEVALRLLILPTSLVMALFPAFSAWSGNGQAERAARTAARAVLYITAALTPLVAVFVTLGGDGLRLWLNTEYARETTTVLTLLSLGAIVNATATVPATLLAGTGRPDIPAKIYLAQLPVYGALAALLISRWGLTGAAAAWSIRVAADALLLFAAAHRLRVLRVADLMHARVPQVLTVVLILLGIAAVARGSMPGVGGRIALAAAVLAALLGFLWHYALRSDGRASIASAFRTVSA